MTRFGRPENRRVTRVPSSLAPARAAAIAEPQKATQSPIFVPFEPNLPTNI